MSVRPILDPPATVLLLGTIHFASNRDLVNAGGYDVTSPEGQNQLDELCDRLAAFAPSVVAIERSAKDAVEVQADYREFLSGEHELAGSEDEQIGFRLAARCGLQTVSAIDDMTLPFWVESLDTLVESDAGVRSRLEHIQAVGEAELATSLEAPTIVEVVRSMNSDDQPKRVLEPYMLMVPWSSGDEHPGAEAVANWYARNLRIFANLMTGLDSEDRAVVVIGAGHIGPLAHFVDSSPELILEPAAPYLA
jgi:hypothetical protein